MAIDVDIPEEYVSEPTVTWSRPIMVNRRELIEVPTPSDIRKPNEVEPVPPVVVMEEYEEVQQETTPSISPSVSRTLSPGPSKDEQEIGKENISIGLKNLKKAFHDSVVECFSLTFVA